MKYMPWVFKKEGVHLQGESLFDKLQQAVISEVIPAFDRTRYSS